MMMFSPRSLAVGVLATAVLLTSGCATFKRHVSDNSLDYSKTRKLDPIALPADAQTLPFTPLYQVPESGANTLKLDDNGKRFDLPPPIRTVK